MKYKFSLIIACTIYSVSLFSQRYADLSESVLGPVKKVTVAISPEEKIIWAKSESVVVWKHVTWFDRTGKILETKKYEKGLLIDSCAYYYADNSNQCICYSYDKNGITDYYTKTSLDAEGRKLVTRGYKKENPTTGDSLVYDEQGKILAKFYYPYGQDTATPYTAYVYDSLGRLIREYDVRLHKSIKVNYLPNGDYIKIFYDDSTKEREEKYIHNRGRLYKVINEEYEDTYTDYDQYGNWTRKIYKIRSRSLFKSFNSTIITRTIEYYEPTPAL